MTQADLTVTGAPTGPLAGVRVLDITSVIMGPYGTQLLGDLGADVITCESARGDTNRAMGAGPHPWLSGVSLNLLRNKRNIDIDLKHPEGRAACLRIAATCDVVVTNLRPKPLAALGLAYADVRAVRPDVVFCHAHGYPTGSPREDEPAYDDVMQAAGGFVDLSERAVGTGYLMPMAIVDKVCGMTIANSILAALFHHARTGEGQEVEVPMISVAQAFTLVEHGAAAVPVPPLGPAGYPRILTPERRARETKDGWICVLPYLREHYDTIFRTGGREDLVGDPRSATGRARIAHSDSLYRDVATILPQKTTAEWLAFFAELGVPASEVVTVEQLVEALPVAEHPVTGPYRVVPPPVRFGATPASVHRHAPLPGEHTAEVLREAGYVEDEITALREGGVFVTRRA